MNASACARKQLKDYHVSPIIAWRLRCSVGIPKFLWKMVCKRQSTGLPIISITITRIIIRYEPSSSIDVRRTRHAAASLVVHYPETAVPAWRTPDPRTSHRQAARQRHHRDLHFRRLQRRADRGNAQGRIAAWRDVAIYPR